MHNALQPASHNTYSRAVELYRDFVSHTLYQSVVVPFPPSQIILFIAHCFSRGLAASTVYTYISGIGYYHKIRSSSDPTQHFVIKICIQGYRNRGHKGDKRLPISHTILRQLVASLVHTLPSHFERILLKAMYLLAFHAFLRIGEMTASPHNLTFQVRFPYTDSGSLTGCEVSICSFKHSHGKSQILHICYNNDNLAASMGVPEGKIQRMGRWSSDAFKKYIRIPVLKR